MTPAYQQLISVLETELALLRALGKELAGIQLMLASGDARFLTWAVNDLTDARDGLGAAEIMRAGLTESVARELGLRAEEMTLATLADALQAGAGTRLLALRDDLIAAAQDVEELQGRARELGVSGLEALVAAEGHVTALAGAAGAGGYDAAGGFVSSAGPSGIDRRA
jgi:hypothetical protein